MDHLPAISVAVCLAGLAVVFLLSIFALRHIVVWARQRASIAYRPLDHSYHDADGKAIELSMPTASKPVLRLAITTCVTVGELASLAEAIITIFGSRLASVGVWLRLAAWTLVLFQCTTLFVQSSYAIHFSVGWRTGLSCFIILSLLCTEGYVQYLANSLNLWQITLGTVETVSCFLVGCLCLLIPRRPEVFHNGLVVDQQYTTSLLGWITFSWVGKLLKESKRSSDLSIKDLPELDSNTRANTIYNSLKGTIPKGTAFTSKDLWRFLFRCNSVPLIIQGALAVVLSVLSFLPQLALLDILQKLEGQQQDGKGIDLWVPVAGLGVSILASAMLEPVKYWISYNKLVIRIQQQLTLAILDKAVRLDRTTGQSRTEEKTAEKEKMDDANRPQSPTNIVSVDVKNVADFFSFFFLLYESPLRLAIASGFLVRLLGWRSLLAGFVVLLLLTAGNVHTVRKYTNKQGFVMEHRDRKLRMVTEVFQGIRQVKFSALEGKWEEAINQARDREMRGQWAVCFWQIALISIYFICPTMLSATCLSVYVIVYGTLSAATAFTAIAVLNAAEVSMTILPDVISTLLSASVSIRRIHSYFTQSERESYVVPSDIIEFEDATVAWPGCRDASGGSALKGLNLQFPRDALSIVTGPTGAGKSLLLAAILGESEVLYGTVLGPVAACFDDICSPSPSEPWVTSLAIAFVSQSPWIQMGTIRDNILFGLPLEKERYTNVIFACALQQDLNMLPGGDLTEIGGQGATLSGGQQWRISLARALYSRAQTLLMDDIFSAVDVHTRQHMCQHALTGPLARGRTCILVTHHLDLCLPYASYIVVLDHGVLKHAVPVSSALGDQLSVPENADSQSHANHVQNTAQVTAYDENEKSQDLRIGIHTAGRVFIREGGKIYHWILLGVAFLGYGGLMLARSWWIHVWTDRYQSHTDKQNGEPHLLYYLGIYIGISTLTCLFGICRTYFSFSAALRASQKLFQHLLFVLPRAPLQWHDSIPFGAILSRFSSDFAMLDTRVGDDLQATLGFSMNVMIAILAGSIVNPIMIIVAACLLGVYIWLSGEYLIASRKVKHLENATKGPILEHIDKGINGISTIRAYAQTGLFIRQFQAKVNNHARAFWHLWLLNRWLGFRINFLGAIFSFLSAAFIVSLPGIDASTAGFAISFTIDVSLSMALSIRRYANLEQGMDSVGRVHSYSTVDTENYNGSDSPPAWPTEGALVIRDLVVRHAPHLPPVLRGVSFEVQRSERVGIVGRTGAGKSSFISALFRFLEASEGEIVVDGIDISTLKIDQLRRRLALIPQQPILFQGTIRSNLDPFHEHDDQELLAALQSCCWNQVTPGFHAASTENTYRPSTETASSVEADAVEEDTNHLLPDNSTSILENPVSQGGENLSQGQRQLLCLARAIITRPKILILDEATSAVDRTTDEFIQRALRTVVHQNGTTLLAVAHRLSTIADFDRIIVMDAGRVVESGMPKELIQVEKGIFRGMVEQDAERDALKGLILA